MKKIFDKILKCYIIINVFIFIFLISGCSGEKVAQKEIPPKRSLEVTEEFLPAEQIQETIEKETVPELKGNKTSDVPQLESGAKDMDKQSEKLFCSLAVRCDKVFENIDKLKPEKRDLIPENGIIFNNSKAEFSEGESVFDVLLRELKNNKIHMEFSMTPLYNTAYVEGINNLYEFDCGEFSGWKFLVNGETPGVGCSSYKLKASDSVEWLYTCTLDF